MVENQGVCEMETIKQMRARHEREIAELQDKCKHKETKLIPFMWAPRHYGGDVTVCNRCGKTVESKAIEYTKTGDSNYRR